MLMAIDQAVVSNGVSILALVIAGVSLRRASTKEDAAAIDTRIEEKIDLKLAPDITLIKNQLQNISEKMTSNSDLVRNTVEATTNAISEAARDMLRLK